MRPDRRGRAAKEQRVEAADGVEAEGDAVLGKKILGSMNFIS
jgi:hypothetical protein